MPSSSDVEGDAVAGLRGTAEGRAGGVLRHGVPHAGPGEGCVCHRHDCGGLVPVDGCAEHGRAVGPVLEWHAGGGIRCTALQRRRAAAERAGTVPTWPDPPEVPTYI
ncbi:hypothetical protein [Streptomyces sp. NPDC091371]|uniref:hypothetical protein n=1 Tax=Streptomyces sp. NPDC091371 TaxID=3155303 RepID=UPI00343C8E8E